MSRFERTSSSRVNYTQSGGTVTVVRVGSTSGIYAGFDIGNAGSSFTMSGGRIVIQRATSCTSGDYFNIASTYNVTGGTLQIGNASTPSANTMRINSTVPVGNLVVDGSTSEATKPTAQLLNNSLTVVGDVTVQTGTTLNANNLNLTVGGNWTNNGTFTPGTGTVTFNGSSPQSINGTTGFYNFALNNAAGVSLGQAQTTAGQLTLTSGQLMLGGYNLTLSAAASIGGSPGVSAMVVTSGAGAMCKTYDAVGSFTFPIGDITDTAEYSPATADFSSIAEAGTVCVRVVDAIHDHNPSATDYLSRYWDVNEADSFGAFNCTLTFEYNDSDIVGTEGNMCGLKYDAGTTGQKWTRFTQVNADTNTFQATVTSFSDYTAGDYTPTAITLASLTATPQDGAILITWETASELDNVGFNLYRSETADGPYARLNDTLIPPQHPGAVLGAFYEWLDVDMQPNAVYYYELEDIDVKGVSTFHGPVSSAVVSVPTAVELWQVSARGITTSLALGLVMVLGLAVIYRCRRLRFTSYSSPRCGARIGADRRRQSKEQRKSVG